MIDTIEKKILSNLVSSEDYMRKVIPFLKKEYFDNKSEKVLYSIITRYIDKYNRLPTKDALFIEIDKIENIPEDMYHEMKTVITQFPSHENALQDMEYSIDETEQFCKDKALYQAIFNSISIMDGTDKKFDRGSITKIVEDALAVSFDTSIGHEYIEDAESRYEFYHEKTNRIPFDLEILNKITGGGLPGKTLSCIMAGTGVGKSALMCHMAAANLLRGKNVLYITLEMAEERISERIDANLMDIKIDDLHRLPKDSFMTEIQKLKDKSIGNLIVKEYPPTSAGAAHFRFLLNELRLKKNFVPDIIYVDYINICMSSRLRNDLSNSYQYVKAIAEELRSLAVEFVIPIITATQTNRSGIDSSEVDLTNTSESMGLPMTVDFMIAAISTPELERMGQIMMKQLKNRFASKTEYEKFVIGVERAKMKFYDLDDPSPERETTVFDNSTINTQLQKEGKGKGKEKFGAFKH